MDNLQSSFNDSKTELPTADLEQVANDFQNIESIKVNSVFEQPYSPYYSVSSLHKTQNLIRYKTRRSSKKTGKGFKFCRACQVSVPFFSLNCKRCHERVVGDLSYYTLWIFSAVIFTLFILFIVSNKTYK